MPIHLEILYQIMVTKSMEGFLIKFCAFRRRSVSEGKKGMISIYEKIYSK